MRILIDITHPAHANFFRHPIQTWKQEGHEVLITSRKKDIAQELLDEFGYEHIPIGQPRLGALGLGAELVSRSLQIQKIAARFRPDVTAAIAGTFLVYGTLFRRVPTVVFYDTEHAKVANAITYPLATAVITPRAYQRTVGPRQIRYNGYQELAYTHPSVFTPNPEVLLAEGLEIDEPFTILRAVNWQASHDVMDYGIVDLETMVCTLEKYGRVLISSEAELPRHLRDRVLKGPLQNMLHLQAFARLLIGESATMASECALLGTPAIFISTSRRGYIDELQDRYDLVYAFYQREGGQKLALQKAEQLLSDPDVPAQWLQKRERALSESVDVNEFVHSTVLSFAHK